MVLHIVLLYPVFLAALYYAVILLTTIAGLIMFAGYNLLPERYQRWWAVLLLVPVSAALVVGVFPYLLDPPPWAVSVHELVLEPCSRLIVAYFELVAVLAHKLINAFN